MFVLLRRDGAAEAFCNVLVARWQRLLQPIYALPLGWRCFLSLHRHIPRIGEFPVSMDIARTVNEYFEHLDPYHKFSPGEVRQQWIVATDAGITMDTYAMRRLKVHQQHADLIIQGNIAHRQEHAVAVVAWISQSTLIEHFDETGMPALIGTGGISSMIDGAQEEHVATFYEIPVSCVYLMTDNVVMHGIGKLHCVELLLECPVLFAIKFIHEDPPFQVWPC